MKNFFKILVTLLLLAFASNSSMAIPPTYQLTAKNITMDSERNQFEFDIFIQWTNSGAAGVDPFNYGSCQYCLQINDALLAGQMVTGASIGSDLPASLQPANISAAFANGVSQLRFAGNLPGAIFLVSSVFPGTKVIRARFTTNLLQFPVPIISANWRNTGAGLITKISYLDPNGLGVFITDAASHIDPKVYIDPVELTSFMSTVNRNNVTLIWATSSETNNQGFDVERKLTSATEWSKVGNVSGNGTTTETKSYSFSDRTSTGVYNYRLKQIDFNGNTEYFALGNEVEVGVPSVYAISQNYPNPFNPTTKIDYDLPYDGKVSISLYDLSGREVGNLVNDVKTAGYYTLQFNASNLSSGMYFYRITATGNNQNFVTTKKMVLVK